MTEYLRHEMKVFFPTPKKRKKKIHKISSNNEMKKIKLNLKTFHKKLLFRVLAVVRPNLFLNNQILKITINLNLWTTVKTTKKEWQREQKENFQLSKKKMNLTQIKMNMKKTKNKISQYLQNVQKYQTNDSFETEIHVVMMLF